MRIIILPVLLVPSLALAVENISCHFDKYHKVSYESPDTSGYAPIVQSLEIVGGTTSKETLELDGSKRGTNSTSWVLLERKGWETFVTTYAGNSGDLLTIRHELGENLQGLNGWYKASLVSSQVFTTHTSLGKCLVK